MLWRLLERAIASLRFVSFRNIGIVCIILMRGAYACAYVNVVVMGDSYAITRTSAYAISLCVLRVKPRWYPDPHT